MIQTLIVTRHAHRNTKDGRELDTGLTSKGKAQARALRQFYEARFENFSVELISSPKKRCLQTLEPLAKKSKRPIGVCELLDEGGALAKKIELFIKKWRATKDELTLVCTHGDWIPQMMTQLFGHRVELSKGGWIQIDLIRGRFHLIEIIQKVPN